MLPKAKNLLGRMPRFGQQDASFNTAVTNPKFLFPLNQDTLNFTQTRAKTRLARELRRSIFLPTDREARSIAAAMALESLWS